MAFAGADSSSPITQQQFDFAAGRLGMSALVWGRYFNGWHTTSSEYVASEAAFFSANNLKLLPVAQQTTEVQKADNAASHARMNVQKFFSRVGLDRLLANGNEYLMFLDIEDDAATHSPVMTSEYFVNWSQALIEESQAQSNNRITVLPAIYGRHNSVQTWQVLAEAVGAGAGCRAAWITRAFNDGCTRPLPDWNAELNFLTPAVALSCPIVVWQYGIDCGGGAVDLNLITADDDDRKFLLDRLIVP
ncbi:MAG TPA: hypothetical protein VG323_20690 [Thermoanaerobaculia bacterium]|nr:hypothetical protein [Thermoanaerobaculia bacterium]